MPFFGSKNKDNRHTVEDRHHQHEPGTGHSHFAHTERVPGSTTAGTYTGTQGTNTYDNSGRTYQPEQYHGPGAGPDFGPVPAGGTGVVPNTTSPGVHYHDNYKHSNRPTGGPTAAKLTGKVESALGSMVGSNTLKAKGLEKERAGNTANLQDVDSRALAEAERLEREALMHRQKVVGQGHGAHPANLNPAAGKFGVGPTQPGLSYPQ